MSDFDPQAPSDDVQATLAAQKIDVEWLRSCTQVLQVDGASMLLRIEGSWRSAVATDDIAARINTVQLITGQGPGVEAFRTGRPVQIHDWGRHARDWPLFASGLGTATVGALFALPLQSGDRDESASGRVTVFGVLHVYRTKPGLLDTRALNGVWLAAETVGATLALS